MLCDILGVRYKVNGYLGIIGTYRAISISLYCNPYINENGWTYYNSLFKSKIWMS